MKRYLSMDAVPPLGLLSLILLAPTSAAAETIILPVVKDNSIVLVDGEWSENAGEQGRLRIKGNQHIVAMAFDTSAIRGRRVQQATLVCVQGEHSISGVTLSTIATEWDEKHSNGLTAGTPGVVDWGYPGARFPAVSGGNGWTLTAQADSRLQDGNYEWDVAPDMVHAMALGIAHGLAIHEHDADYGRNPTIFAREQSAKKPYLRVTLDDQLEPPPSAASDLQISGVDEEAASLTLVAPTQGFAYEVFVGDLPLGRHNIPRVIEGETQVIPLRDLPSPMAGATHRVRVITLNRTGQRSEAATAEFTWPKPTAIAKPTVSFPPAAAHPVVDVAVIPVSDKYDQRGDAVGSLPKDYRTHNAIYDGQRVRLRAAAGEVVGIQLLIRGAQSVSVAVEFDDPLRVDLHQAVYVAANGRLIPDPLLPLPPNIQLAPDADQSLVADIFVPFDALPGQLHGSVNISDGRTIAIDVEVLPFSLPRQATFVCEMNSYGLPDSVEQYDALQRIAYDHRLHANILHYSHNTAAAGSRKSNLDMRLKSGQRMDNKRYDDIQPGATTADWGDFTKAFGPFLDGSLFEDGHRGPIAPPGFYLTFHESWPLHCRPYFNGDLDAYKAFSAHPEYARTFVDVLASFAKLAHDQSWNQAGFQVYLNNKGSLSELTKAPWILDEPTSYWDYRALRFYGELTDRGRRDATDVHIDYRIDISRPEFCRGELDGRDDLWVVASSAFKHYRRLVTDRIERDGLQAWVYGTSNQVHESNRNLEAWALDVWKEGASGLVPWQTVDKDGSALEQADQLGLFIYDKSPSGEMVVRHSLRLKAYREAQQLIEYLNLLQAKRGWKRSDMRQFIGQYVDLDATVAKVDEADAGTSEYGRLSAEGIQSLKHAAAQLLAE